MSKKVTRHCLMLQEKHVLQTKGTSLGTTGTGGLNHPQCADSLLAEDIHEYKKNSEGK